MLYPLVDRNQVILVNFDPLRTIVLPDRLIVILPSGADGYIQNKYISSFPPLKNLEILLRLLNALSIEGSWRPWKLV